MVKQVPVLRFPEFSGEWHVKKLGDFSRTFSGGTPTSSKKEFYSGDTPFIKSGEIASKNTAQFITDKALKSSSAKLIKRGDILYALYGATSGQVAIAQIDGAINQAILCIRPEANRYFIYSKLRADKINILNTYLQGGQGNLSADIIKKLPVGLPSKEEQEKIAKFLTVVDDRVAATQQKVELLKKYKKGVMQKIFTQQTHFKDKNGQSYSAWKEKRLGDIFDEVTRKVGNQSADTYSITAGKGFVSQKSKFGRDISGGQNKNYTLLEENDFSYNKGNSKTYTYGCVYANKEGRQIAVPSVFISFTLKNRAMAVNFYANLFEYHYLDRELRKIISSGARMDGLLNVSKNDFFNILVPVPEQEEQQKIANFLITLDNKIKAEEAKLTAAKIFKKALLQRLFV